MRTGQIFRQYIELRDARHVRWIDCATGVASARYTEPISCPLCQSDTYRVWFITESGVVPSVQFDMDPARADFEFTSTEVPQGLRAVSVTIEAVEGADEPSDRQVLFADQAMRLL